MYLAARITLRIDSPLHLSELDFLSQAESHESGRYHSSHLWYHRVSAIDKTELGLALLTSAHEVHLRHTLEFVGKSPVPAARLQDNLIKRGIVPRANFDALLNSDTGQQDKVLLEVLHGRPMAAQPEIGRLYLALPGSSP